MKRLIKIGGRAQSSARLRGCLAAAWADAPGSFCLVHGGGDEISELQRRLGSEPSFVAGRRVTTSEDVDLVRMVLSGLVNKRLVSGLVALGVPATGISGEDAATLVATELDSGKLGRAGKPVRVNPALIRTLIDGGYLPVISPLAAETGNPRGEALNVNGDDAASAMAVALHATELLFVADVAGVLNADGERIISLDQLEMTDLVEAGVVSSGMHAKLEAGFAALAGGVHLVRISSLDGLAQSTAGTLLVPSQSLVT